MRELPQILEERYHTTAPELRRAHSGREITRTQTGQGAGKLMLSSCSARVQVKAEEAASRAEDEEPAESEEGFTPPSLRSLCATKLVRSGKYGGRKLPSHFHYALSRHYIGLEEHRRCARHLTMAWCGKADMSEHLGLCCHSIYMSRRDVDENGALKPAPQVPSLVNTCISSITANEEVFPNEQYEFLEQLREQQAEDSGGGGKKGGKKK